MKPRLLTHIFAVLALVTAVRSAELPAEPPSMQDKLIFSDDFERAELGPAWKSSMPGFTVANGVLVFRQGRAEELGVINATLALPDGNIILELKIRFRGARSISLGCSDKQYAGSHVGHIAASPLSPPASPSLTTRKG